LERLQRACIARVAALQRNVKRHKRKWGGTPFGIPPISWLNPDTYSIGATLHIYPNRGDPGNQESYDEPI